MYFIKNYSKHNLKDLKGVIAIKRDTVVAL